MLFFFNILYDTFSTHRCVKKQQQETPMHVLESMHVQVHANVHTHTHSSTKSARVGYTHLLKLCITVVVKPHVSLTPQQSVLYIILLYSKVQLYDRLALPDSLFFSMCFHVRALQCPSCQQKPEPVFSHQIVSNTERAYCAEQRHRPCSPH